MIELRRATERYQRRQRNTEVWQTFGSPDDGMGGFGMLESLDEWRFSPRAKGVRQRQRHGDVITYVREGVLAYVNSVGQAGVVHAGEFHRRTATLRLEHRESNGSHAGSAQVFQIALHGAEADLEPSHELRRFSVADRRDGLCIVASVDARRDSLLIHFDALVCSAVLHAGQHVVHELAGQRRAWLHIVHGEVGLHETTLCTGDGAGFTAERALSLTAKQDSEILLIDLGAGTHSR